MGFITPIKANMRDVVSIVFLLDLVINFFCFPGLLLVFQAFCFLGLILPATSLPFYASSFKIQSTQRQKSISPVFYLFIFLSSVANFASLPGITVGTKRPACRQLRQKGTNVGERCSGCDNCDRCGKMAAVTI